MIVPMIRVYALLAWAAAAAVCHAQDRTSLAESLNFEAARAGSCPAGWSCNPPSHIAADSEVVHGGKWSVRIERRVDSERDFSTITKILPIDFAGKTVELRGFIRTEDIKDFSAFWMRTDSDTGSVGFATMQGNNPAKGTAPWTEYTISLPLKPEANTLVFGFLLSGPGKAWADDLQLLVDGKSVAEAPKVERQKTVIGTDHEFDAGSGIALSDLTKLQIENLATLGKVWGFVKYHHPQVTEGHHHFDYELFRVVPKVLAASDRAAANRAMLEWIRGLGEVTACDPCASLPEENLYLRPHLDWIKAEPRLGAGLSQALQNTYRNRPAKNAQFYVSFVQGVGNPVFENEPAYGRIHLPDAGYQILALFRYWNMVEYWFPDRNVIGEDWDAVLTEFLPRIALAKTRDQYQLEMMQLIARVHDTHANLWSSLAVRPPVGACQLPVDIRFVEGQAVVASYLNAELGKATGLQPGDVIEQLDGADVSKLVKDWTPYYAASNDPTRLRDIGRSMTHGDCAKPIALGVRRGSETLALKADRLTMKQIGPLPFSHDLAGDTFRLLSKDVAYLKLSTVKAADVPRYIDSAAGTKGMVIDIRNYPSEFVVFALGQLLVDKPSQFVSFTRGDPANPGAFHFRPPISLQPRQPHYAGKVVILVDEISQSQAEYTTMAFRSAGAAVVGSTTAGADGNVSQIPLPGGLNTMFSGLGVFYPDQRPTQRVGILPDLEVKPTIEGIRAGRDEVLEAAIRRILGPDTPAEEIRKLAKPENE